MLVFNLKMNKINMLLNVLLLSSGSIGTSTGLTSNQNISGMNHNDLHPEIIANNVWKYFHMKLE